MKKAIATPDKTVALAGNPNVGKSTVFNGLTGLRQHTGNWSGKTVETAEGLCRYSKETIRLVDLPGTYSLATHSPEEEVAREFLCLGDWDTVVILCDACCLERNLTLVLQILEITPHAIVCLNLIDEAARRGIRVLPEALAERLGVPVLAISAKSKADLRRLTQTMEGNPDNPAPPILMRYPLAVEAAITKAETFLGNIANGKLSRRWIALQLLTEEETDLCELLRLTDEVTAEMLTLREELREAGYTAELLRDIRAELAVQRAQELAEGVTRHHGRKSSEVDRRLDRILTGKPWCFAVMLALLLIVFYLTIRLSNYPSQWLSSLFAWGQNLLTELFFRIGAPPWLHGLLVLGVYRTLGWVISVMLPPMMIFFPLFTLLEEAGYLPRIAFNLDRPFCKCNACGKQALTMCMGFGCNAVGVTGCRIIDSKRERLLAILTNAFVPCNGKFPALIALLTLFFIGSASGVMGNLLSAALLTLLILLSLAATLAVTKLLSLTLLRGEPSAFTLELPPYRRPQVGRVILRSILDRSLLVLGRAAAVAAPAGAVIWLLGNLTVGELSLLAHLSALLDPIGRVIGLDGVILTAFLLGLPANEIVIPIMLMAYSSNATLVEATSVSQMGEVFAANGWTPVTGICVILFFLFHWPCSTTLLTVRRETKSIPLTLLAALLPTAVGCLLCGLIAAIAG
ncbi:MAG: ferrous iron transport protein B [Ruminococcaceae bacterium]|nr:ferrous iron transport protein B [Oscillospiraceae bacterium]